MKQINTYSLYQLANQLAPLRTLPIDGTPITRDHHAYPLFFAAHWIKQF